MFQESIYIKILNNGRNVREELKTVSRNAPKEGMICMIPLNLNVFHHAVFGGSARFDMSYFAEDLLFI